MITDTLDNLGKYAAVNPLFADVVAFIESHDLAAMEDGKYPIKGTDLFVNIQTAHGKKPEEAAFETHRRMIDIQIPLSAPEAYGYMPLGDLPEMPYNEEKDVTKYQGIEARTTVCCRPGEFAVFFPQDGHQPCIGEGDIKKAIFKVRV